MRARQHGELCRRHAPAAAVGSDFVVVAPPGNDHGTGVGRVGEHLFVQAFVPEAAVEVLDVSVLHWPSWFDQQVLDPVALRPTHECATGEFRSVVRPDGLRIAAEVGSLIEDSGHVGSVHSEVHGNIDAFVAEVIGHRQVFEATVRCGHAVADEIQAPHLVASGRRQPRNPVPCQLLWPFPASHLQFSFLIEPENLLVIGGWEFPTQHVVHTPVSKAPAPMRDLDHPR